MSGYLHFTAALVLLISNVSFAKTCNDVLQGANSVSLTAGDFNNLNLLMNKAVLPGSSGDSARPLAQRLLDLDNLNFTYYLSLFKKFKSPTAQIAPKLYPATDSRYVAYPVGTDTLPKELESQFEYVAYDTLLEEFQGDHARSAVLVIKKLHAGTGSSMKREAYFKNRPEMAELLGVAPGKEIAIGAKGTDLLVQIPHPEKTGSVVEIPIAELQLLQAMKMEGSYSKVILQDIVGPETQNRLSEIWKRPALTDPNSSYAELFRDTQGLGQGLSTYQAHVPALDESGDISFNRYAPAGHGLFAVDALLAALRPEQLPDSGGKPLITAIANGEDLNSLPDPVIIDWMIKTKVPITLVTTSKTSVDKKGGLLTLVQDQQTQETYLKVIDTAEASALGQLDLFVNYDGLASTNLTLFNYEVLQDRLKDFTEQELLDAMAPDLVPNWKEQVDKDGVTRRYLQLEGTMGTTIMNLDRYYRLKTGERLVSVVNIESHRRTEFFSPIKAAFDYFLQFHSDRFSIDPVTYKLKYHGGAEQLSFSLTDAASKDKYYQDVQNVLDSFTGTSFKDLDVLQVSGRVSLRNCVLRGRVVIVNETSEIIDVQDIADRLPKGPNNKPVLENLEITWTKNAVQIKSLETEQQ